MSFASTCADIEAFNRMMVRAETFGHLEALDMQRHHGWFIFTHSQHGDMVVIQSDFPTFGEGPGYFDDRQEFIWRQVMNDGPCDPVGVYRFDGFYKLYAKPSSVAERGMLGYFKGKITKVKLS